MPKAISLKARAALLEGAVLVVALLCVSLVSLSNITDAIFNYEGKVASDYLLTVDTTMEATMMSMQASISRFANEWLLEGVHQLSAPSEFALGQAKLRDEIMNICYSYSSIEDILIVTSRYGLWGNVTRTFPEDMLASELVQRLEPNQLRLLTLEDFRGTPVESILKGRPTLAFPIVDPEDGQVLAALFGMLDPDVLFSLEDGMQLLIADRNFDGIWCSEPAAAQELIDCARSLPARQERGQLRTLPSGRYLVASQYSPATGLNLVFGKRVEQIPALRLIYAVTGGLALGALALGLGIIYRSAARLVQPLLALGRAVRHAFDNSPSAMEGVKEAGWLSVRRRLILQGGGGIVLSLALFISALYVATNRYVFESAEQAARNTVKQAALCIDLQMEYMEWTSLDLALNEEIQKCLMNSARAQLMSELDGYIRWQENLTRINLYSELGELMYSTAGSGAPEQGPLEESTRRAADAADGKPIWVQERDARMGQAASMVRRVRNIYRESDKFKAIGYIKLVASDQLFEKSYQPLLHTGGNEVYVDDGRGGILSGSRRTLDGLRDSAAGSTAALSVQLEQDLGRERWRLVARLQSDELYQGSRQMLASSVRVLLAAVAAVIFVIGTIAYRIVRPIQALGALMTERTGILPDRGDEVDQLTWQFTRMFEKLDALVEELSQRRIYEIELTRRKNEAEMAAYQAQINPHFLSNTLLSVNMLIQMGETEDARAMLRDLGKLFEMMILRGENMIPIVQEAEYLRAYLSLQKMRFDRLTFRIEVAPEVAQALIPRMSLQPLVENALYHGLELYSQPGRVVICARKWGEDIRVYVYDNGKGMSERQIGALKEMLASQRQPERIGLWNVNERLTLYLGARYEMTLRSIPGKWTLITIIIREGAGNEHVQGNDR